MPAAKQDKAPWGIGSNANLHSVQVVRILAALMHLRLGHPYWVTLISMHAALCGFRCTQVVCA